MQFSLSFGINLFFEDLDLLLFLFYIRFYFIYY